MKGRERDESDEDSKKGSLTFHSGKCKFSSRKGIAKLIHHLSGFLPRLSAEKKHHRSVYFSSDYLFKTNEPKYFCGMEESKEKTEKKEKTLFVVSSKFIVHSGRPRGQYR